MQNQCLYIFVCQAPQVIAQDYLDYKDDQDFKDHKTIKTIKMI